MECGEFFFIEFKSNFIAVILSRSSQPPSSASHRTYYHTVCACIYAEFTVFPPISFNPRFGHPLRAVAKRKLNNAKLLIFRKTPIFFGLFTCNFICSTVSAKHTVDSCYALATASTWLATNKYHRYRQKFLWAISIQGFCSIIIWWIWTHTHHADFTEPVQNVNHVQHHRCIVHTRLTWWMTFQHCHSQRHHRKIRIIIRFHRQLPQQRQLLTKKWWHHDDNSSHVIIKIIINYIRICRWMQRQRVRINPLPERAVAVQGLRVNYRSNSITTIIIISRIINCQRLRHRQRHIHNNIIVRATPRTRNDPI